MPSKKLPQIETEPPKSDLHTCPYREDIDGDYETLCDCDEAKQHECTMDI